MMPVDARPNLAFAAPVSQEIVGAGIVVFVLALLGSRLLWPRMPSTWRLGLWGVALAGVGALAFMVAGEPNAVKTIAAPRSVERVSTAKGAIVWAVSNMLLEMSPATGQQTTLLRFPPGSLVQHVARSPDGNWFAMTYTPAATGSSDIIDLYVVANNGAGPRLVLSHQDAGGGLSEPAWSADGQSIYATVRGAASGDTSIVRVPRAGGPFQKIADNAAAPTLSRDGKYLYYVRHGGDAAAPSAELWQANPDGTNARLVDGSRFAAIDSPAISPDGSTIAFAASGLPQVARARTSRFHLPRLGPATASAHGGDWEIWTLPRGGGTPDRKSAVAESRLELAWSPDGKQLAATADLGLYIVDPRANTTDLIDVYTGFGLIWYEP